MLVEYDATHDQASHRAGIYTTCVHNMLPFQILSLWFGHRVFPTEENNGTRFVQIYIYLLYMYLLLHLCLLHKAGWRRI